MEDKKDGGEKKGWGILRNWRRSSVPSVPPPPQEPEKVRDENKIEPGERMQIADATHLTAPENSLYLVPTMVVEQEGARDKFTPGVYIINGEGSVFRQKASGISDPTAQRESGLHIIPQLDHQTTIINNTPIPFERGELETLPFGERKPIGRGKIEGFELPSDPLSIGLSPNVQVTLGESQGTPALFYGEQVTLLHPDVNGVLRATIGRQPGENTMVVPSSHVSRSHGEVMIVYGDKHSYIFLRDKNSKNGMEVTRAPIQDLSEEAVNTGRELGIETWKRSRSLPLMKSEQLRKMSYKGKQQGKLRYYFPESTPDVSRVFAISTALDRQLRMPDDTRRLPEIDMMRVPSEHVAKSAAKGTNIILNTDSAAVAAHELTHGKLSAKYGQSASTAAIEGTAMYMTYQVVPEAPKDDMAYYLGFIEVAGLAQQGIPVGVSPTEMLGGLGRVATDSEKYEYSYRFGRYLIDYLDNTYGRDFILKFYESTCGRVTDGKNLDGSDRILAIDGRLQPGVKERDLNDYALAQAGKLPGVSYDREECRKGFDEFIKTQTENAIKAPLRKWVADNFQL